MLVLAAQRQSAREIVDQIMWIVGAATRTAIGPIPPGNTGSSNVIPFKRMTMPDALADTLAAAAKPSAYSDHA